MGERWGGRRAVAACVVAAGVLALGGCSGLATRAAVATGYGVWFALHDADGDGALDRGEVAAMVARGFPPERRQGAAWDALRAWAVAQVMAEDRDGDGRLTRAELMRGPLAAFDCIDGDGDWRLSRAEMASLVARCVAPVPVSDGGPGF